MTTNAWTPFRYATTPAALTLLPASSMQRSRDIGDVMDGESDMPESWTRTLQVASMAGLALGAYHGYRRNDSVGWAIGWGLLGSMFPFITIPVALAQGFGKPAK